MTTVMAVLFVVSTVACINWAVCVVGAVFGRDMHVPIPLLHKIGINYSHAAISSPAISYQVYFWANYAGVI